MSADRPQKDEIIYNLVAYELMRGFLKKFYVTNQLGYNYKKPIINLFPHIIINSTVIYNNYYNGLQ